MLFRSLVIGETDIRHLPSDLEAKELLCTRRIPESEVREFLYRAKVETTIKPKFQAYHLRLTAEVKAEQLASLWSKNLAANEAAWEKQKALTKVEFMTRTTGSVAELVDRCFGGDRAA